MPNFIFTKNKKQHLTQHEVFDKIWTILVVLRLAIMIVYGIVIQILHPPWIPFGIQHRQRKIEKLLGFGFA